MEPANSNMEPAATRFFNIQELVSLLASFLDHKGISRVMQTNCHWCELFAPALHRHVHAYFHSRQKNIFGATESILALFKNSQFVRELDLGPFDLAYYVNCVFAFQDVLSQTTGTPFSRPQWLAPPDPHLCSVLLIPPMTLLTTVNIEVKCRRGVEYTNSCPYYLPSSKHPRMNATRFCWILQLNQHLQHVTVAGFVLKDDQDIRLFTTAIHGLMELQDLSIAGVYEVQGIHQLAPTIFFSWPPLLQTLSLDLAEEELRYWTGIFTDDYTLLGSGRPYAWEKEDEECDLTTTPRRQGPLKRLTHLSLMEVDKVVNEKDPRKMLQHCPNLCDLVLPDIGEVKDVSPLANTIAATFPKLRRLAY
ncbi:hypothetical protein BGW39_004569 [Mortierella sp. 14UC]|nr:hypothetical protein BGW39_004569 [Mortierella sp. 14UC]